MHHLKASRRRSARKWFRSVAGGRRNMSDASKTMCRALIRLILSGLAAAAVCLAQAGELKTYVWRDADGKVHYGDQPPPDQAFEEKTIPVDSTAARTPSATGKLPGEDTDDDDSNDLQSKPLSQDDLAAIARGQAFTEQDDKQDPDPADPQDDELPPPGSEFEAESNMTETDAPEQAEQLAEETDPDYQRTPGPQDRPDD